MYGQQGSCSIVVAGIVEHTRPKPLQQSSTSRSSRNFCASLCDWLWVMFLGLLGKAAKLNRARTSRDRSRFSPILVCGSEDGTFVYPMIHQIIGLLRPLSDLFRSCTGFQPRSAWERSGDVQSYKSSMQDAATD
jgi:hypothetical protein